MDHAAHRAPRPGIVYTVDDDASARSLVVRIIERGGWVACPCASGAKLLGSIGAARPACIVMDLMMPKQNGLDVQRELTTRKVDIPIIFLTGADTISMAVDALHRGAFDLLEKPINAAALAARIEGALLKDGKRTNALEMIVRIQALTPRELQVCELLMRGLIAKQIAAALSISTRTVEHHREHILRKTGAKNTTELAPAYAKARVNSGDVG